MILVWRIREKMESNDSSISDDNEEDDEGQMDSDAEVEAAKSPIFEEVG